MVNTWSLLMTEAMKIASIGQKKVHIKDLYYFVFQPNAPFKNWKSSVQFVAKVYNGLLESSKRFKSYVYFETVFKAFLWDLCFVFQHVGESHIAVV